MFPSALPQPRIIDPTAVPKLRWGVIGAGWIAAAFVDALHKHTRQSAVAVAARELTRAQEFAAKHQVDTAYDSYEQLVSSPEVDVVYVATLNRFHLEHALLAIRAGKHVLVEKPMTLDAAQAKVLIAAAREAGVLAMEAMWTNFLPQTDIIRQLLDDGVFGDIAMVSADFGHSQTGERLLYPEDGGALLDLGIYPIAFATNVLGAPVSVHAQGQLTSTGVDAQSVLTLEYASKAQAVLTSSIRAMSPVQASICGSGATLEVHRMFFTPSGISLSQPTFGSHPLIWVDRTGVVGHEGLSYQATAMAKYIGEGLLDSPLRPMEMVVNDLDIIETARHQLGAYLTHERK